MASISLFGEFFQSAEMFYWDNSVY